MNALVFAALSARLMRDLTNHIQQKTPPDIETVSLLAQQIQAATEE